MNLLLAMSESENTIKEYLEKMLADPVLSARLVDGIVHGQKRPAGWSKFSRAPFYNAKYATEVKEVLDGMIADRKGRVWKYSVYADVSPTTIYLRVNQGMRYLLENMDPDNVYARFRETIVIRRDHGRSGDKNAGVHIEILPEYRVSVEGTPFVPETVTEHGKIPKWKEAIESYLSDAQPGSAPLVIEGLMLTPQELADIKCELAGLQGTIMSSITATTIKLIKRNPSK